MQVTHNAREVDQMAVKSANIVADLEVILPAERNNADFINDVLIPAIFATGFHAINREIRWCKNKAGQNVLGFFGATEGRVAFDDVIATVEALK